MGAWRVRSCGKADAVFSLTLAYGAQPYRQTRLVLAGLGYHLTLLLGTYRAPGVSGAVL